MTTKESRQLLRLILAAWSTQHQKMAEGDIRTMDAAYAAGLADLDFELAKAAVGRLVRTNEWLPTVAAIRLAAGVLVHGQQKTGGEAWGQVMRAMREQGSHRTPGIDFAFSDPITSRVIKAFGWADLCASDNAIADRARFIEAYDQIAKQERTEAQASPGAVSNVLPLRVDGPRELGKLVESLLPPDEVE